MSDADVFLKNNWGHKSETLSGSGSTMAATVAIRANLPALLAKYNIQSMFDAPCGDGNWMSHLARELVVHYTGGDLVEHFSSIAGTKGLSTEVFDIRSHSFPPVDLWFCRDCWYHLPYSDIQLAVDNWLRSSIKWGLFTSHVGRGQQVDIKLGGFRRLNLAEHSYFGLPVPVEVIPDVTHPPEQGGHSEEMMLFRNPNV